MTFLFFGIKYTSEVCALCSSVGSIDSTTDDYTRWRVGLTVSGGRLLDFFNSKVLLGVPLVPLLLIKFPPHESKSQFLL